MKGTGRGVGEILWHDAGEPDDAVLAELLDAAKDRTLPLVTHREAVPGAAPILRHVDEVVSLSGP